MKKKRIVFLLPAAVLALGSCDFIQIVDQEKKQDTPTEPVNPEPEKPVEHVHAFVDYPAVEATCTTPGSLAYSYCEGCGKYFTADHKTEIVKDSWFGSKPALGHDFLLVVEGQAKMSYLAGEEFDPTGLVVKKVCQRDDCDEEAEIKSYFIKYQQAGQTAFKMGDTKVYIVVGADKYELTGITVAGQVNNIIGLQDSYTVDCHHGISLAGVSATSGAVSAKYYTDVECSNEVQIENMVAGVYYVKVTSDGLDPNYTIAEAVATVNVQHKATGVNSKAVIGYKDSVCEECGESLGKSTEKMTAVEFADKDDFGMDAHHIEQEGHLNEGNDKAGAAAWINETDSEDQFDIKLPKVDFTLFQNVVMKFASSGNSTYGPTFNVGFEHDGDVLMSYGSHGVNPTMTLEFIYDAGNGKVQMYASVADGETNVSEISDDDVICGVKSVELTVSLGLYRSVYLQEVLINHTHQAISQTLYAPKDVISYMCYKCECGAYIPSQTLMADSDVDLSAPDVYGANATSILAGNEEGNNGKTVGIRWVNDGGTTEEINMSFPRINYKAFDSVIIPFATNSDTWGGSQVRLSINSTNDLLDLEGIKYAHGSIIIEHDATNNVLNVKSVLTNGATKEVVVNNEDVMNGKASLTGTLELGMYRGIFFNGIYLNHESHVSSGNAVPSTTTIGYKVDACSVCLEEVASTELMTTEDISLATSSAYGANATSILAGNEEGNGGKTGGIKWSNDTADAQDMDVSFPKINFKAFDNVYFLFGTNTDTWGGSQVTLSINGENDLLDLNGTPALSGNIYFHYDAANNKVVATSTANNGATKTIDITNEDIMTGKASLTGTFNFGIWRAFYLNSIVVNHSQHVAGDELVPSITTIGYKNAKCAICGAETLSTAVMTSADIALENGYGAGYEATEGTYTCESQAAHIEYSTATGKGYIKLPKVNFNLYTDIEFNMYYATLWGTIGLTDGDQFGNYGDGTTADVIKLSVVKQTNGDFKAMLSCPGKGVTKTAVITDTDVLSGAKSLPIYMTGGGYICLRLTQITVSNTCEHEVSYTAGSVIGVSTLNPTCPKCGGQITDAPATRTTKAEEIDYSKSLFGAKQDSGWGSDYANTDANVAYSSELGGCVKYTAANYEPHRIEFPKVDYSRYQSVTFPIQVYAYYNMGLKLNEQGSNGWNDSGTYSHVEFSGKLKVEYQGANNVLVTLLDSSDQIVETRTDADANLVNGTHGVYFYANIAEGGDYVIVGKPTLVEAQVYETTQGAEFKTVNGTINSSTITNSSFMTYSAQVSDYCKYEVVMPKFNFGEHSTYTFQLTFSNAHYGVGFDAGIWNESSGVHGSNIAPTLVITNNGENNLTAELTLGGETVSTTITDADIYSGTKGLSLFFGTAETNITVTVSLPVVAD